MKAGDKVSVIDDDLGGTITSVQGSIVTFQDEHGFSHQVQKSQLVARNHAIYEGLKMEYKHEHRKVQSKRHNKSPFVLDLHFEKLVKDPSGYKSFERLLMQKEKLLQALDYCKENHLKSLEIIHGIGDGVLQKMVYTVLEGQANIEFHNREILHEQSGTVMVYFR